MNSVRFAGRMLAKNPGFTLIAVLTLAIGIGANTAMFSVVNALFIRTLPFPESDRLVLLFGEKKAQGRKDLYFSWPNFVDLRQQAREFESFGAWALGRVNLTGVENPEQLQEATVNADFFRTMGVRPLMGRWFLAEEDQLGGRNVVIVSHSLWERRFGAGAKLDAQKIELDGQSFEVVGVMPPAFQFLSFPSQTEVWIPFGLDWFRDRRYARAVNTMGVVARVKPGVALAQAQNEVNAIAGRLAEQFPENRGWTVQVTSLKERVVKNYRAAVLAVVVAVGLVLLIACTNVANLLLARGAARRREIAIRSALGATRAKLLKQLLAECLLLSAIGGALGFLFAFWGIDLLAGFPMAQRDFGSPYKISTQSIRIDTWALLFMAALSFLTALLFGLAPSFRAARVDLSEAMKTSTVSQTTQANLFGGSILVAGQIALSVVLLVGAGLLLRSFARLQQVDPGFKAENIVTANLILPRAKYPTKEQVAVFYDRLLPSVAAAPGVKDVSAVEYLPLTGIDSSTDLLVEGKPPPSAESERRAHYRNISANYFQTMGMRMVEGREFTARDTKDAPRVAIINEAMKRRYWPNENPIGKRVALRFEALRFRPDGPPNEDFNLGAREIVGIVADVKHSRLDAAPVEELYTPYPQRMEPEMTLVVKSSGDPAATVGAIREAVRAIDKDQPLSGITTMAQLIDDSLAQRRFLSRLLGAFAAVALALSAIGLYGLISFGVTQRTREFGIRIAVGAQKRDVLALVLGNGARLAMIGAAVGIAITIGLSQFIGALLFEVAPTDPITLATMPSLLMIVALIACWAPARRATNINPIEALRYE